MTTIDRDLLREHAQACRTDPYGIVMSGEELDAILDALEQAEAERDEWRQTAKDEHAAALDLIEVVKVRDQRIEEVEAERQELAIALDLALVGEEVQTSERHSNATALARAVIRADQAEARIADALALCSEWEAMGTRQMNIGAVRRALNGDA